MEPAPKHTLNLNFKPDEALKIFKPIIPKDIANQFEKAIRSEVANEVVLAKVQSIIKEYMTKVYSTLLADGEQVLWRHNVEQGGHFHKEVIEKWIVTNFKAMNTRALKITRNQAELREKWMLLRILARALFGVYRVL
jgi:hypothetical protein